MTRRLIVCHREAAHFELLEDSRREIPARQRFEEGILFLQSLCSEHQLKLAEFLREASPCELLEISLLLEWGFAGADSYSSKDCVKRASKVKSKSTARGAK